MGVEEELYQLFAQPGLDRAGRSAAFQSWVNTRGSNQMLGGFMGRRLASQRAKNLAEFAENEHQVFSSSLKRIISQLKEDESARRLALSQESLQATLARKAVELEQTAIRDLIGEEIETGCFDREMANAIYQEELQAARDQLVESMQDDPEYADTLEADIALVDERLNRVIDVNAFADEEDFIYAYGELPTWPAGRPAPADYQHPTPLTPVRRRGSSHE